MQVIHRSEKMCKTLSPSTFPDFFAQMKGNEAVCVLQGSIWVCGSVWKCSFLPPHAAAASLFESFVGKAHGSHPTHNAAHRRGFSRRPGSQNTRAEFTRSRSPTPPLPPMLVGISGTKEDGRGREGSQLQTAEISSSLSVVLLVEKGAQLAA